MKEKLFVILLLVVIIGVLAALSAATYTQKEKSPDNEATANRSSYNAGPTGTQAFYTLLTETGHKTVRWQQPATALLTARDKENPAVFVVVGYVRRGFEKNEIGPLMDWVADGGRLVLIDREPGDDLIKTTSLWNIEARVDRYYDDIFSVDPGDNTQMTRDAPAVKPVLPSSYTAGVNSVQPSRYAGAITISRMDTSAGTAEDDTTDTPPNVKLPVLSTDFAPAVHIASGDRNLLVDAPYGRGSIVILSDPYIVSNGGISLVDNARLGVNLVAAGDGIIAFDEYHQGYGGDNGQFLKFFAGTPAVAMFIQAVVIVGFLFFSQSRRFGRPVPEPEPDRLTKLEYVAAMAELQQRTRAYDLAIENIYTDFRRRVTRALGLDNLSATPREIAVAIVGVSGGEADKIENALFKCEEIVRGEPTNKREVLRLVAELRDIENRLGLHRGARKKI